MLMCSGVENGCRVSGIMFQHHCIKRFERDLSGHHTYIYIYTHTHTYVSGGFMKVQSEGEWLRGLCQKNDLKIQP